MQPFENSKAPFQYERGKLIIVGWFDLIFLRKKRKGILAP
jgi:hypothetical protein